MYNSRNIAKYITWHATRNCKEYGKMCHPVDGKTWKDFDQKHKQFALELRNVPLGLAADSFNPFGNLSQGSVSDDDDFIVDGDEDEDVLVIDSDIDDSESVIVLYISSHGGDAGGSVQPPGPSRRPPHRGCQDGCGKTTLIAFRKMWEDNEKKLLPIDFDSHDVEMWKPAQAVIQQKIGTDGNPDKYPSLVLDFGLNHTSKATGTYVNEAAATKHGSKMRVMAALSKKIAQRLSSSFNKKLENMLTQLAEKGMYLGKFPVVGEEDEEYKESDDEEMEVQD
nr:hypothetical protein [Tanacetum cinerariifolium]